MTPAPTNPVTHHWRAYGQLDGTVVCDADHDCNLAADVNELLDEARLSELRLVLGWYEDIKRPAKPVVELKRRIAHLENQR